MVTTRLRLSLLLGLIIAPAAILTFLSLRTVLDERGQALTAVRAAFPTLRQELDDRLLALAEGLSGTHDPSSDPYVELLYRLDGDGIFEHPPVLASRLAERSDGFSQALSTGEFAEFGTADLPAAAAAYARAVDVAATDEERAEGLNALSRVWLAAGDVAASEQARLRLADYPHVLDADGAHPLSLSLVRRARHLSRGDSTDASAAADLVHAWVQDVASGRIPMHPGIRLEVPALRSVMRHIMWHDPRPDVVQALTRLSHRADFVALYDRLLETAVVRPEATYLSGTAPGEQTFVALQVPHAGGALGALLDLDALASSLLTTDAGRPLAVAGFRVALIDADDVANFEWRYDETLRHVAPISSRLYRLNAGIYSGDTPFVFEHYRNRTALLVSGIALLGSTLGLGVWVLLRETRREVDTARLRSEFVANVSHELRTPLTAIRLHAETLLLGRVRSEDQRRQYLETMMRESQRLGRMVGNILEFSRLESGRKSFDFDSVDVSQIVRQTLEEFEPVLDEHGFEVVTDIAESLPTLSADAEALRTVVANLLSNAVKYSPTTRQVVVRVCAEGNHLVLEVADRGIGIPEAERRRVFEKYRRADNIQGVATGTGLGLALVEAIVRAHNGHVAALPNDGGGTRMRVALPTDRSAA